MANWAATEARYSVQNFGVTGDGSDESVKLKQAHDQAYALGIRELYFPRGMTVFAPNAQGLGDVHFRGDGAWAPGGAPYRKQIIPENARAPFPSFVAGDLIPSVHLRRFSRALNPVVVLVGDSTGVGGDALSQNDFLTPRLRETLAEAAPGRTVTFVNESVGGSSINGADATFVTNEIAPHAPDLVIVNWGTNTPTEQRWFRIDAFVDLLLALPKVPDIVFCTNLPRGITFDQGATDYATASAQRDQAASATRNFAKFNGYGLLDFHRMGCMARDGYDPCNGRFVPGVSGVPFNYTAVATANVIGTSLPETPLGFSDITFQIDNTGGAINSGTAGFGLRYYYGGYHKDYSPTAGQYLRMVRASSALSLSIVDQGGGILIPLAGTGAPLGLDLWTFQVQVRENFMRVLVNNVVAWEQLVPFRGGPLTPFFLADSPSPLTFPITRYLIATPTLYAPSLRDVDMFGGRNLPVPDGNGVNHPASPLFQTVTGPVLAAADMSPTASGVPLLQTITAAGAIDTRAGHVQITGPASSTYAVTLAAPGATDGGRTMVIEMVATTATNAVTLALTNVVGGSAASTASFDAAGEQLVLVASGSKWVVTKELGVTLS